MICRSFFSQPGVGATCNDKAFSSHILRLVGKQKADHTCNILWDSQSLHTHILGCLLFSTTPKRMAELGLDQARTNTVHSNIFIQEFLCEHFSQGNQSSLSNSIMPNDTRQVICCIAGEDDDRALLLFSQFWKCFLHQKEGTFVVNVPHFLDLILFGFQKVAHLCRDSCIEDQKVKLAVFFNSLFYQLFPILFFSDMADNSMSFITLALELRHGLIDMLFVSA